MNALPDTLAFPEALVPAIGWALLDFLWQGALVGVAATLALTALRRACPQARYAICCVALALCVALPFAGVLRGLHGHASLASISVSSAMQPVAAATAVDATLPSHVAWNTLLQAQLPWIVALWALGAALLATRLGLGMLWVRGIARSGSRMPGAPLQARFDRLVVLLGARRDVALRCVEGLLTGPVAAGIWRPVVLVPAALVASMPADLLEALLAHELAHVRRHDYLVNLMQGAAEALLFFHPVTWWLSRHLRNEREQIADDLAAHALDDPRRLALALQQLDQMQSHLTQSNTYQSDTRQSDTLQPNTHQSDTRQSNTTRPNLIQRRPSLASFAPAAQGGHLMSRIQRLVAAGLVRPQTSPSLLLALPVLGLAAACLTVYARAPMPSADTAAAMPVVAPAAIAAPASDAFAATFPGAALAVAPAIVPAAKPVPTVKSRLQVVRVDTPRGDAYAVVRAGKDGMNMSADSRDIPLIARARRSVHGDFVWVRHDGKAWVVQDPALIAQVTQAWAPAEALGARMDVLGKQMAIPSAQMEELGRRMEALSDEHSPARVAMERVAAQMQGLSHQQEAIGLKMEAVGMKLAEANEPQREILQRQMETLQVQMEPLDREMERMSKIVEAHGRDIERAQQPMEEMSRKMQAASVPMEALGRQMEALGRQEEQLSREADRAVRVLIDNALRNGKAVPADDSRQ